MARARPQKDSSNGGKKKQKATYAIFLRTGGEDGDIIGNYCGDFDGVNAKQAARNYLKTLDSDNVAGTHDFVVIPRRNMSLVGLTVETSLKIS